MCKTNNDIPSPTHDWTTRLTVGTYKQQGKALSDQLRMACKLGVRRFDTAQLYHNEQMLAKVVRETCTSGTDVHVTTKVYQYDHPQHVSRAVAKSLKKCSARYLRRILLHNPMPVSAYQELEASDIDEVGVSNFSTADLRTLNNSGLIKKRPCVNQIEFHPFVPGLKQTLLEQHGVLCDSLQAHTVMAKGLFMNYRPLVAMAQQFGCSPAQVLLRFAIDCGLDVVVQSSSESHLNELISVVKDNNSFKLSQTQIDEMFTWSDAATGGVPSVFYPRRGRVPPVPQVTPPKELNAYIDFVSNCLTTDLTLLDDQNGSGEDRLSALSKYSDIVSSLPPASSVRCISKDQISCAIASKMYPGQGLDAAVRAYVADVRRLKKFSLDREVEMKWLRLGKFCRLPPRGAEAAEQADSGDDVQEDEQVVSSAVKDPIPMPVTTSSGVDLAPFFTFLLSSTSGTLTENAIFKRGALFTDGRMDMCKQVVGSTYIGDLCDAVTQASPGLVRHFLLGNNVACRDDPDFAAYAIGKLMRLHSRHIETWYLAGNYINAEATKVLVDALLSDSDSATEALWLKRNPIHAAGAKHLSRLVQQHPILALLDLHNTGLMDDGVEAFTRPLIDNGDDMKLKHLYLDANGITEEGAKSIAKFVGTHVDKIESLYLSMNRLGDAGWEVIARSILDCLTGCEPALKRLNLASCGLTDVSLRSICAVARACSLTSLEIGYYKSTVDLGEHENRFTDESITSVLVDLLKDVRSIEYLGVGRTNLPKIVAHRIRQVAAERDDLWISDGYGKFEINGMVSDPGRAKTTAEAEQLRAGVKHPRIVVNIDSIYRGKM